MSGQRPPSPTSFEEGIGKCIAESRDCNDGSNFTLYVAGIPPDFTPNGLRNLFNECGAVRRVNLLTAKQPGLPRVGFVEYATMSEVLKALEMFAKFQVGVYTIRASVAKAKRPKMIEPCELPKNIDLSRLMEISMEDSSRRADERYQKTNQQGRNEIDEEKTQTGYSSSCKVCKKICFTTCCRCKSVYYCGSTCQADDWNEHKNMCKVFQQARSNIGKQIWSDGVITDNTSPNLEVEVEDSLMESVKANIESVAKLKAGLEERYKLAVPFETLCAGKALTAILVDVEQSGVFFLHIPPEDDAILCQLVSDMTAFYSQGEGTSAASIDQGHFYACQFYLDHQWYRAFVQSVTDDKSTCNVWYIDFGNCEDVPPKCLMNLDKMFVPMPAHSARCRLSGCAGIDASAMQAFISEHLDSPEVYVEVLQIEHSIPEVEMYVTVDGIRVSLNNLLKKLELQENASPASVTSPLNVVSDSRLAPDQTMLKCLSGEDVNSVVYEEKNGLIKDSQTNAILCAKSTSCHHPDSASTVEYEAKDINRNDAVSHEQTSDYELGLLHWKTSDNIVSEKEKPHHTAGNSKLALIFQKMKKNYQESGEFDKKIPPAKIPEGKFEAVVTHVGSVEEISLSVTGLKAESFKELQEEFNLKCSKDKALEQIQCGQFCAVKTLTGWRRAKILSSVSEVKFLVYFVDYGSKDVVKAIDICKLPAVEKFWRLESLAITCCLKRCSLGNANYNKECMNLLKQCENESVWAEIDTASEEFPYPVTIFIDDTWTVNECIVQLKEEFDSERKFSRELPQSKESEMKIENLRDMSVAEKKSKNTKLNSMLCDLETGTQVDVIITHCADPGDFTCQIFGQNLLHLSELSEKMSLLYENNTSGSLVPINSENLYAVKYHVDSIWYRAAIVNFVDGLCEVLFVDYGNTEMVQREKVKPLLDEFAKLPIQGIKSSLHGCSPGRDCVWSKESIAVMTSLQNKKYTGIIRDVLDGEKASLDILTDDTPSTVSEYLVLVGLAELI